MFRATVNDNEYEIASDDGILYINKTPLDWDVSKISEGKFHILYNNKSFRTEVVKVDVATKSVTLKVNNHVYAVSLKDKFDLLLEKLGMNNLATNKVNNIKAPMPGLIIDLKVKAGDEVKAGDPMLILEAMKMENVLKAPGDGLIKSLKVKKGDSVEKNQVLIEF
jgi:biotin carboxyl carrier protein